MTQPLLIFVPGFMASSLRVALEKPNRTRREQLVWSESLSGNLLTLNLNPGHLSTQWPALESRPLRHIAFLGYHYPVYGPILNYVTASPPGGLGLPSSDLLTFGYDWRQSISTIAEALATLIRERFISRQIVFLGHSMGGLVVRFLLSSRDNEDILRKTTLLIQVGTPQNGSAHAYFSLKRYPYLEAFVGSLPLLPHNLVPAKRARLQRVLHSFPSLLALLPRYDALEDHAGKSYSAFSSQFWSDDSAVFRRLREAEALLSVTDQCTFSPIRVVYGSGHNTHRGYRVLPDGDISFPARVRYALGDKTVVIASSLHCAPEHPAPSCVEGSYSTHVGLCNSDNVRDLLRSLYT